MTRRKKIVVAITAVFLISIALIIWRLADDPLNRHFFTWSQGTIADRASLITVQRDACASAPFILPADGYIGLLYEDPRGPYSTRNPHQGIDIFSNTDPGLTPVYAAFDGYVTREESWTSTLIQRVPSDPLQPERQIWLYYTHMADRAGNDFIEPAFAPGTREFFVEQGTILGYTGDYNGNSARSIWTHLHFSIVQDDGNGRYRNELDFANSIDPTPYLNLPINYQCAPADYSAMACTSDPTCS